MPRPHIVITDDNPADQELCILALESAGWSGEITCLSSGDELLARLEASDPPDLVILDLKMPGVSGHDVLAKFVNRERPPFVVLTSSEWPEERERVLAHPGVHAYLTKPPQSEDLSRMLAALASG
ncbi:MAG: response regulator [Myxococcota bacterium]